MSEPVQPQNDSPLVSERGVTKISDGVVSQIAGMAAQEVEGVHMGGTASRTAGGLLGGVTGSESQTRGVSVEVGRIETAIDLKMGVEYGRNILQSVDDVRRRIIDRVQNMTGLRVTELNVTIADITFPEKEQRRRLGSGNGTSTRSPESADTGPETSTPPRSESRAGTAERETTEVDSRSQTRTEDASGPASEEGRPPEEAETAGPHAGGTVSEQHSEQRQAGEEPSAESETRESETEAEARRRKRAEERARRRRRSEGSDEG